VGDGFERVVLDPSLWLGARGQQWIVRARREGAGDVLHVSPTLLDLDDLTLSYFSASRFGVRTPGRLVTTPAGYVPEHHIDGELPPLVAAVASETYSLLRGDGVLAARRGETMDLLVQLGVRAVVDGQASYLRMLGDLELLLGDDLVRALSRRTRYLAVSSTDQGEPILLIGDAGRWSIR
jgi:hypothetical protein